SRRATGGTTATRASSVPTGMGSRTPATTELEGDAVKNRRCAKQLAALVLAAASVSLLVGCKQEAPQAAPPTRMMQPYVPPGAAPAATGPPRAAPQAGPRQ